MTDLKFLTTDEQRAEAYAAGADAARFAASWVANGNTDRAWIEETLRLMADGDPMVEDRLPAYPTLSGEWADDPTPQSLAREILGDDVEDDDDRMDELADAWEAGTSETFEQACEAELRLWIRYRTTPR